MSHRLLALMTAVALALAGSSVAHAQATWQGSGGNGTWTTLNNWNGTALSNTFNTALVFQGSGNLTNYNDYTSGTATSITFNSGAGAFTLGGNAITLTGSIANLSTSLQTINMGMSLTRTSTVTLTAGGGNLTLGGNILNVSGSTGGLALAGSGTLTLSGANQYTGNTTIGAGTVLIIGSTSAIGSGTLTFGGVGGIDVTSGSSFALNNNFQLSTGGTFNGSGNLTINGTTRIQSLSRTLQVASGTLTLNVIDASATGLSLTKGSAGALAITGSAAANYTGGFKLDGGTLILGHKNALGTGNFTFGSAGVGTLQASTDLSGANAIPNNVSPFNNATVSGANSIEFSGTFTQVGANRILTNNLAAGKSLTFGAVNLSGTDTVARTLTLSGSGNTIFAGIIADGTGATGSGLTISSNTGTTTLSGNNTYKGNTTISDSTAMLVIGSNSALGSGTLVFNSGNTVFFDVTSGSSFTLTNNIALSNGSGTFAGSGNLTINGTATMSNGSRSLTVNSGTLTIASIDAENATRNFTKNGSGTLVLTASAGPGFSGTFSQGGGVLVVGHKNALGGGVLSISSGTIQAAVDLAGVNAIPNAVLLPFSATIGGTNNIQFSNTFTHQGGDRTLTNNVAGGRTLTFGAVYLSGTDTAARTLTVSGSGNTIFGGIIADGTGAAGSGLTIRNTGTTRFSAANTFTGNIIASGSGGRLVIDGAGRFAGTSGTYAGTITGTNVTFEYASSADSVLSGIISGTMPIVQNGLGTLTLGGVNTFAGGVTLAGGQLTVGSTSAFGTGTVTITGGSLDASVGLTNQRNNTQRWNGNFTFVGSNALNLGAGAVTLGASPTVTVTSSTLTVGGVIDDGVNTYGLTKAGAGTLVLGGANTYGGATRVDAGVLRLEAVSAISSNSAITLGSVGSRGALLVNADLTISSLTFDGRGGELSNGGSGVVTLANATTGTATINVLSGTSQFHNNATLGSDTVVDVASGAFFAFHNNISGNASVSLVKSGSGTLEIVGDNDGLSGSFFIRGGRVNIGSGMSQIGTGTTTLSNGAILDLGGQAFTDRIVVLSGTIFNAGGTATTTTIDGPTTLSGTTVLQGTYNVSAGGVARFDSIVGNGSLITTVNVASGGQATFGATVSGAANITVYSGGAATFSGTTSGYVIAHGVSTFGSSSRLLSELQVKDGGSATFAGSTGATSTVTIEGGGQAEFRGNVAGMVGVSGSALFTNASTVARAFSTASGGAVTLNDAGYTATDELHNDGALMIFRSSGSQTISSAITGVGTLTKTGDGVLVLDGANTYTGLTTISGGTLAVGSGGASGSLAGDAVNNAALVFNRSGATTFGGIISGSGLVRLLNGSLTLSSSNSYSGGTWIDGGMLTAGNANAFGTNAITLGSGATLNLNGLTVNNTIVNNGGTIIGGTIIGPVSGTTTLAGGQTTFSSTIEDGARVEVASTGTATFGNGASVHSGATVVNNGVVRVSAGNANNPFVVGSAVSGSGQLRIEGGATRLDAANSYTGNTVIGGSGVLKVGVNGSFADSQTIVVGDAGSSGAILDLTAKSGTFAFGSDQTLKGGGTILLGESTVLDVQGTFSPGNSPGLFTYNGGTTLLSGTSIIEIWGANRAELASHGTGPYYDAVDLINGARLDFNDSVLTLDFNQSFADNTTFYLFSASGSSSLLGNFGAINVTGSAYTGLTWTKNIASGKWTSSTVGSQSLEFNSLQGTLVIIPEPDTIIFAGIGIAMAGWSLWKRRRIVHMLQK